MSLPGVTRQSLKLAEGEEITGVHVLRPVGTVRHEGFLFQGPPRRVIDYSSFFHIEVSKSTISVIRKSVQDGMLIFMGSSTQV